MNDQEFEIINRETKKQKVFDFVKKNKNIIFVLILLIIFCFIGFFSYEMYLNNKRSNLANKFNNSVNSHKIGNNENILGNMVEIINSNDKTYSPLALYYLLDNNLIGLCLAFSGSCPKLAISGCILEMCRFKSLRFR